MDNLPKRGFHGDMRTGLVVCLSFFALGVRGDFGIFGTSPTCAIGLSAASSMVISKKPTPLLVVFISFELSMVVRELGL